MSQPQQRRERDNTPPFWSLWPARKDEYTPPVTDELKTDFLREEALPFLADIFKKLTNKK